MDARPVAEREAWCAITSGFCRMSSFAALRNSTAASIVTARVNAAPDTPAFDTPRRALRRSVAVEAVLGAVVLVITMMLTGTQPSRAEPPWRVPWLPFAAPELRFSLTRRARGVGPVGAKLADRRGYWTAPLTVCDSRYAVRGPCVSRCG
ncbi:hypothetical protein [Streptomyces chartreusis]|uniref:hypothetical protein n=1 Tax=Streptomyces chartreusis TaxID=1969 RepID=UPI0034463971